MNNLLEVINFNEFKIFNKKDSKYLYSVKDNKIFQIDDKTIALLNQEGKTYEEVYENLCDSFNKKELEYILNNMVKHGFIKKQEHQPEESIFDKIPGDIRTITLLVVQECNLRCSYCYGEDGNYNDSGVMDINTAKKSVDFLIEKSKSDSLSVCFFGGEPLLKFDLIKEVIAYCCEKEKETNKKFGFTMTTNGTLINKEIEDFIIDNKIKVQISIDGDKRTHDCNRYYSGKIGSHDMVLRKTESLRKKGLVDARATITGGELNLIQIYDYLSSIGFAKIALSPAFNLLSDEEYEMLANAYIELYLNFEKRIKEKKYKEVLRNKIFMQELGQVNNSKIRRVSCGVARNLYAIDINGDIYPCQRFVSNKEFALGNVFKSDSGQEEFLKNRTNNNNKKCSSCWARNLCVAGCPHSNLSATGDINLPYEPYCKYVKKVKKELINIYLRLSDKEIEILFGKN